MLLPAPLSFPQFGLTQSRFGPLFPTGPNLLGFLQQQLMASMLSFLGPLFQGSGLGALPGAMPAFGCARESRGTGLDSFLGGSTAGRTSPAAFRPAQGRGPRSVNNSADNKFTTLNVNIKSRPAMSQDKVVRDVNRAARNADLIGWNEISLDRYRKAIKNLGPEWGHYMPRDGKYPISNPISYRKEEWKLEKGGFQKTHEGAHGIVPDRYITWAKLRHKASQEKIVRINTHTVPGAFNKSTSHNAWRRASWNTHMSKLSAMVKKFRSQGYKVIIGGDFNKDSSKVLGNQVNYANKLNASTTDGGSTLDYLMHTRNPGFRNTNGGVLKGFNSDHHAVQGTYVLGNAGRV